MPTELYRTWNYRFIVPPGFVGFVGETIIERRSREYVYEGTFHDRFVPFALATNLETIHDASTSFFEHLVSKNNPLDSVPRYMTL